MSKPRPVSLDDQISAVKRQIIQRRRLITGYRNNRAWNQAAKEEQNARVFEAILANLEGLK